ncbi:MAG: BatA domain-containing protein [Phycisphaeraceae bacterium]
MTFLNIALVGGVLAFNIPLIIHLLNRSKFKTVKWGAMHLLAPVVRTNRKRIRMEQLLLLLVRAMIPVLLALAMAGPVLTGCQDLAGGSRSSLVVVLDNSYSMSAGGANASFNQARDAAMEIIRDLREGSDVSVILMAGGSGTGGGGGALLDEPTSRSSLLTEEIKRLTAAYGRADAPSSLQLAADHITRMKQSKRDMIVISDFQRVSWGPESGTLGAAVTEWRKSKDFSGSLTFLHTGKETTDNVAIIDATLSRTVVGVGQKVMLRVHLKNFGSRQYPSLRVYLDVDTQRRGVSEITLGPGEDGQAIFSHEFDTPGSHLIHISAEADATLKEDNEFLASIHVVDRIPVLLVDGDPAPPGEPLRGETGFLSVALQPYRSTSPQLSDLLAARTVPAAQFNAESLGDARAIVLANVPRLSDEQLRLIEGYVQGGGGLLIFPGNKVDRDWYNDAMYKEGGGLLPLKLGDLRGSLTDATQHTTIISQQFTHPALTLFNDRRNGNLGSASIWQWYRLEADALRPASAKAAAIAARLDSGDPFLAEKPFGDGAVLLCATACDGDWSSLPVRQVYVPFMQQLGAYAAMRVEPPRNVQVGQPLVAHLPASLLGQRATMTDPSGRRHPITLDDRGTYAYGDFKSTRQLGPYVLDAGSESKTHFVVSSPREESDLKQLTSDEMQALAKATGAEVVRTLDEYRELDRTRRHGRPIWHWFFYGLLALFFAELLLQQRFAGKR